MRRKILSLVLALSMLPALLAAGPASAAVADGSVRDDRAFGSIFSLVDSAGTEVWAMAFGRITDGRGPLHLRICETPLVCTDYLHTLTPDEIETSEAAAYVWVTIQDFEGVGYFQVDFWRDENSLIPIIRCYDAQVRAGFDIQWASVAGGGDAIHGGIVGDRTVNRAACGAVAGDATTAYAAL